MDKLLNTTQDLCRLHGITPARSKGQNFLITEEIYDQIIEAADLKENDVVLEVGPGLGFLTAKLAKRVKQVIAVELDDKLASILQTGLALKKVGNVKVVNEDILKISNFQYLIPNKIPNSQFPISKYKIVANLPYNITSFFLRKFLESESKPEMMVLMLQKEVAERIVARPPKMSLLGISVQFYADAEIVLNVPRNNFWPVPAVDSAVIRLITHPSPPFQKGRGDCPSPLAKGRLGGVSEKDFFRLVKFGFSAKRKMLKNNLSAGFKISDKEIEKKLILANIKTTVRAQELSIEDWYRLFGFFY
jgi:16S rRNA (adenine1518-N6/adenine1519-N6)-dimethyltransferase